MRALGWVVAIVVGVIGCVARPLYIPDNRDLGDLGDLGNRDLGNRDLAPTDMAACGAAPSVVLKRTTPGIQRFGDVAAAGCSFAGTWLETRGGGSFIAAAIFRADAGQWIASPTLTVSERVEYGGSAIAWDGQAYVIAWTSARAFYFRRIAEDGTMLGPVVRSIAVEQYSYVHWIDPVGDGSLRVGLLQSPGANGSYLLDFARVSADGSALLAPTHISPADAPSDIAGFARGAQNLAIWAEWSPGFDLMKLRASTFDDNGVALGAPETLLDAEAIQTSRHGVVIAGGETYFGVWTGLDGVVGRRRAGGYDPLPITPGDRPALAMTGDGALGVLAGGDAISPVSELSLSILRGGVNVAQQVISTQGTSYSYALAANATSFGVFWAVGSTLHFTVRAP